MRRLLRTPCLIFQSTPSVGRATDAQTAKQMGGFISIHALRGEGDACGHCAVCEQHKISIHALRGEGDKMRIVRY